MMLKKEAILGTKEKIGLVQLALFNPYIVRHLIINPANILSDKGG